VKTISSSFHNSRGQTLEGRLEMPVSRKPKAYGIFAHCFTCTKNIRAATAISRALASKGIAVLRFDFSGLGGSEGDFAESTFSSDIEDIVSAASFLRENYEAPQILVGHSLGGAAVLHAASSLPEVAAVSTIGAPFDPDHVTHLFESKIEEIKKSGAAQVDLAGRTFTVTDEFLEDLKKRDPKKTIKELGKALLVMHSPRDTTVDIENAAKIYSNAKHPKSFITLIIFLVEQKTLSMQQK